MPAFAMSLLRKKLWNMGALVVMDCGRRGAWKRALAGAKEQKVERKKGNSFIPFSLIPLFLCSFVPCCRGAYLRPMFFICCVFIFTVSLRDADERISSQCHCGSRVSGCLRGVIAEIARSAIIRNLHRQAVKLHDSFKGVADSLPLANFRNDTAKINDPKSRAQICAHFFICCGRSMMLRLL
jgi:hypothetical protein